MAKRLWSVVWLAVWGGVVAAASAEQADVCSFAWTRLFVRDGATAALVACQPHGSSAIDPRCVVACDCRELQASPETSVDSLWGICETTTTTNSCVMTATRRDCRVTAGRTAVARQLAGEPNVTTTAPTTPSTRPTTTTAPPTTRPTTTNRPATTTPTPPATTTAVPAATPPTTTTTAPPQTTTAPTTAPPKTTAASATTPAVSTTTNASSSGGGTDRTTMIVVVACVVAVFAVVVVVAIVRAARRSHDDDHHVTPTTPADDSSLAYNAPATLKVRARPTHVTPFKPRPSTGGDARPSQAHTERTTLAMSPRESGSLPVVEFKQESMDDDDVAMLESYANARAFQDGTFLSAVNFDDSSRSLDVDAYRRSAEVDDVTLTTASNSSAYWRLPEDTLCFTDGDELSSRGFEASARSRSSFTDAVEPPQPRKHTPVDF